MLSSGNSSGLCVGRDKREDPIQFKPRADSNNAFSSREFET
jgi:hypothetical protein